MLASVSEHNEWCNEHAQRRTPENSKKTLFVVGRAACWHAILSGNGNGAVIRNLLICGAGDERIRNDERRSCGYIEFQWRGWIGFDDQYDCVPDDVKKPDSQRLMHTFWLLLLFKLFKIERCSYLYVIECFCIASMLLLDHMRLNSVCTYLVNNLYLINRWWLGFMLRTKEKQITLKTAYYTLAKFSTY